MSGYGLGSRAIIGEFFATLNAAAPSWVDLIAMKMTSDQASEDYKWLGMAPAMREWIGGRNAKGFRENGITIRNKEFEATLEVLVSELRRDKTGQLMIRVREMARRTGTHWASLLTTLIMNGPSTACYDGQFFFDTDHTEGDNSTNQSNDLVVTLSTLAVTNKGSITSPSAGTMREAILQAVQAILGFKDDQNEPMNEDAKQFLIMVPTGHWAAARAAVGLTMVDSGDANILADIASKDGFDFRVACNPRLTWTDKFAVFRTDAEVKPFIAQEEVPVQMKAIAEGSELEFKENKHQYGVYASRNVGYGYWQQACFVDLDA